jgi:hypothetical protein
MESLSTRNTSKDILHHSAPFWINCITTDVCQCHSHRVCKTCVHINSTGPYLSHPTHSHLSETQKRSTCWSNANHKPQLVMDILIQGTQEGECERTWQKSARFWTNKRYVSEKPLPLWSVLFWSWLKQYNKLSQEAYWVMWCNIVNPGSLWQCAPPVFFIPHGSKYPFATLHIC